MIKLALTFFLQSSLLWGSSPVKFKNEEKHYIGVQEGRVELSNKKWDVYLKPKCQRTTAKNDAGYYATNDWIARNYKLAKEEHPFLLNDVKKDGGYGTNRMLSDCEIKSCVIRTQVWAKSLKVCKEILDILIVRAEKYAIKRIRKTK